MGPDNDALCAAREARLVRIMRLKDRIEALDTQYRTVECMLLPVAAGPAAFAQYQHLLDALMCQADRLRRQLQSARLGRWMYPRIEGLPLL